MLGNFQYHNPTRLHFGENALDFLADELKNYGPTVEAPGSISLSNQEQRVEDHERECQRLPGSKSPGSPWYV